MSGSLRPARSSSERAGLGRRRTETVRLWTRGFVTVLGVNLLLSVVFYLLITSLAVYAADRFAADDILAGLASSAYILGAVGSRLTASAFVDRVGARRLFLFGAAAFVAASGLYLVVNDLWLLILVRLAHGLAFGITHSAVGGLAQARIPTRRRGEGTGYFAMAGTVGAGIGPLLAVMLLRFDGFSVLFLATTAVSLTALLVGLTIPRLPADAPRTVRASTRIPVLVRPVLPIGWVALLQSLGYASLTAFLTEYSIDVGSPASAGWFFLLYAGCVIVVRLFAGRVYDRFGTDLVVYPGLALYLGGLILLAFPPGTGTILAAAVLIGIGYGALLPAGLAIAAERAGTDRPGGAFATYFMFVDLGYGLGPVILGGVLGLWGWSAMFLAGAGAAALAGVLYLLVQRGHRRAAD
ncbi:MFS transporter [Microbacterium sp. 67-17]|uniref:MFS transporter n=1 Tax=Microbacterium sp. 67-17 TaxID=1895782 RepID=UPI000A415529|nr:MFS transporter [Microbacterium sp. 67-17]